MTLKIKQRILLGAGGHAKVLLALCRATNISVDGICDPELRAHGASMWEDIPVLGDDNYLKTLPSSTTELINGLGHTVYGNRRAELFRVFRALDFRFLTVIHPFTWIAQDTQLGEGVQVMAGGVIQPGSSIGADTIINTHASVDHDCLVEEHCHIAPGAVICGGVTVKGGAFVGAGAVILPGMTIGKNSIVGAGTTLYRDLEANHRALASKTQAQCLEQRFK